MPGKRKKWLCLLGLTAVFAGATPALGQSILLGPSCNSNGIDDPCDIDCSAPDCNTNDCGGSTDCDSNGKPDECDPHAVYYVDIDATGNSNGLNWVDAYVDLKLALDDINANMPCGIVEIWVAEGWYYPSDGTGLLPRRKAIRLYDNFYVYGGFAGGETSRINRDSHH